MMEPSEKSPAVALRNKLSQSRRPRGDSVNSTSEEQPRRGSASSVSIISKIRSKVDGDLDDSDDNKVAKLLPGYSKRKEKRRKRVERLAIDSSEELRGRPGNPELSAALGTGASQSTLGSSSFTTDSEEGS